MIPLEEIYDSSLFDTSIVSYWEVPKRNPTLKSIKKVNFERFNTSYIFGRDDNFMVKKIANENSVKIYNFYGYEELEPIDRLMHFISGEKSMFSSSFGAYIDYPQKTNEIKIHFRDSFSSVDTEYYFFKSKEEAYEHYAITKAMENNKTSENVKVEGLILDRYPEIFV